MLSVGTYAENDRKTGLIVTQCLVTITQHLLKTVGVVYNNAVWNGKNI